MPNVTKILIMQDFLIQIYSFQLILLQEPAKNHKSDDQALKSTLFPRILWEAKCYSHALAKTNVGT